MEVEIEKPDLTSYQKEILYSPSRFTVTEASTKIGKTFSHIWWIYERAHEEWNMQGFNHWWVAPVYNQTKIAFKRLTSKIGRTGLYGINQSNLIITCPNGAEIHFKSADKPDNLFGEDVYSIVYDEAPRGKVDSFYALRSTITATKGKMKLIGNFGGNANWVHQLKEKAETDKNYSYHKINCWDGVEAGILDKEEIEQAQRDLPAKIFQQLYLAEETEVEDMLLTYDSINDLFTNEKQGVGKYITSDIAHLGSDLFTIIVWDGLQIIDYYETNKVSPERVTELIESFASKHQVGRSRITYDADGLGSYLKGYLKGAKPFHNGGKVIKENAMTPNYKNLKSQCAYGMAKLINDREVSVRCEVPTKEFKQELECLHSYKLDLGGKIQIKPKAEIKKIIGRSPDRLDAIIMRYIFEIKPKKFRGVKT